MATLTTHRPFLIQVMTGDTDFVGCCLVPVLYFPVFFIMTLPALVVCKLLVLLVSEVDGLFPHLEFYDLWAYIFRLDGKYS
jgi:hypothetical protein